MSRFLLSIFVLFCQAYAGSSPSTLSNNQSGSGANPYGTWFDGSIALGFTDFSTQMRSVFLPTTSSLSAFNHNITKSRIKHNGIAGGAALGAGTLLGTCYIGGEIGAKIQNIRARSTSSLQSFSASPDFSIIRNLNITMKESYRLAFKLGTVIGKKTLIYGIGGAAYTHFTWKSEYRGFTYDTEKLNTQGSQRLLGGTIGLGSEVYLTNKMSIFGEATYTQYASKKFSHPQFSTTTYRPSSMSLDLGIRLKF